MPTVPIDRKQIHYWVARGEPLKEREVVLFIHGAGGGEYTWSYQKGFFEKEFHPVILELPGHGKSGGEGEQEIEKYAQHVHTFLRAMGFPKVTLVGHSMGGAIVQTLALTNPEMIGRIVLVGTGAKLRVFPMILDEIKSNFKEASRKIAQFAYSPNVSSDLIERGITDLLRCEPEVLYGDFLACDRFDVMSEVEKIDLPTLILCGEEDRLTPVKYSQFLQNRIRHSKMEILPGAGHMVMMESPGSFNQKIKEFLVSPTFLENS
ncbi:MAG: alpha/beta fold hydrolase [Thermodesulfobacteriota bacterium]